ncbi:hypothetical protein VUR80DRAFT_3246 [Thermomyces stellatus]
MQSLLTRAGRARNCGCKTCFGVAKTIVRRSTTGAEVKVSYRHAFTTLYTSILATAAVVDAKYKDDRRKHLEDQISEARDAVARLQLQNAVAEAEVRSTALETVAHNGAADNEKPTALGRAEVHPSMTAQPGKLESSTAPIFKQYGGKHWDIFHEPKEAATLRALTRSDYRMLERMLKLSAKRDKPLVPGLTQDDWTHNIEELVHFLLLEHDRVAALQDKPPARSQLREAIDRLKSAGYPNARSPGDDPMAIRDHSFRLYRRMARDIDAATDVFGAIERICYNLLTSQQPLTAHTYYTMIVHLNKSGLHNAAQCVLKCYIARFRQHIRQHHPESQAVILNHDREFKNYAAAYRNVNVILNNTPTYLLSSPSGECVLDSAVRAFAHFRDITHAVVLFCYGLSLGLTIGAQALLQLIGLCIWKLDRTLALKLVRAFTDHPREFESMLTAEPGAYSVLLHQVNYLLDIANLWRHPSKLRAQLETHGLDPERFRRFRMSMEIHNIHQQSSQIQRTTERIQKTLYSVRRRQDQGLSRADAMEVVVTEATRAAGAFDFHMEAAMPATWLQNHVKASKPARVPQQQRRVWTAKDHEVARVNLRLAALSKEVADGARELANCSLELREMGCKGLLRQERPNKYSDVGNVGREPVVASGLG